MVVEVIRFPSWSSRRGGGGGGASFGVGGILSAVSGRWHWFPWTIGIGNRMVKGNQNQIYIYLPVPLYTPRCRARPPRVTCVYNSKQGKFWPERLLDHSFQPLLRAMSFFVRRSLLQQSRRFAGRSFRH